MLPYYHDGDVTLLVQYRAPVTRHHYLLSRELHPLTTNTTCFVIGAASTRQYGAAHNHGEGMCAVAALMQGCNFGESLRVDQDLCPSLSLAECRLQVGRVVCC